MFKISIIYDLKNKSRLDGLIIPNAEISWFSFNDVNWIQALDEIDLLIITYDGLSQLPKEILDYSQRPERCAILPVCACNAEQDCTRLDGFNQWEPTHLSQGLDQLTLRIKAHLGAKRLREDPSFGSSIFISYRSTKDHDKAEALVKELKKLGYTVAWDREWEEFQSKDDKDDKLNDTQLEEIINKYLSSSLFVILVHT